MDAMLEPVVRLDPPGLTLTPDRLAAFLDDLAQKGRVPGTLESYRRNISFLYE